MQAEETGRERERERQKEREREREKIPSRDTGLDRSHDPGIMT